MNNVFKALSQRLMNDKSFKEELIKEPRKAVFEASGFKIPDEMSVEIFESKEDDLHFILN